MATPRNDWMPFHEFFALAQQSGVDEVDAAEALLERIKKSGARLFVAGVFRKWDPPSQAEQREWLQAQAEAEELARELETLPEQSGKRRRPDRRLSELRAALGARNQWKERLPRDSRLKVLPISALAEINAVAADLSSSWTDDPEVPEQFIEVDWLSGALKLQTWEFRNIGGGLEEPSYVKEEYSGLHVERGKAKELLKRLSGASDQRGAPKGLRSEAERKISRLVIEAMRTDGRPIGQIVGDFLPPKLPADEWLKMQRRITRDVRNKLRQGTRPAGQ